MSSQNQWNEVGDEFKRTLNSALNSGDFSNLNHLVNKTVNMALDEARVQTERAIYETRQSASIAFGGKTVYQKGAKTFCDGAKSFQKGYSAHENFSAPAIRRSQPLGTYMGVPFQRVGGVGATLYTVFGGIGLGISSVVLIVFFTLTLTIASGFSVGAWIGALVFLISCGLLSKGINRNKFLKRAKRYVTLGGTNKFVSIEQLTSNSGKSKRAVVKDIRKMLDRGIFPEGHLDSKETCLIFTNELYKTYLELERAQEAHNLEDKNSQKQVKEQNAGELSELDQMIAEGNEYVKKLRNLNDQIAGEVISEKLFCLENVLKEIFIQLRVHPEKMSEMKKFINYYLPTTMKLVEAYAEFDHVSTPGNDIISAKGQIENTLDTINDAFQELLNNIFRDKVFDVTTDAQVLQTLLMKEGLVGSEFERHEKEKV